MDSAEKLFKTILDLELDGRPKPKLGHEEFVTRAILNLRDISKSRGIHCVFSGFNAAFRQYFRDDPVDAVKQLAKDGKIEIRPVRKGVMIYLPGEAPASREHLGTEAMGRILGGRLQDE